MDGIFYWTGKGLNWDMYGHNTGVPGSASASLPALRMRTATTPARRPRSTTTSGARITTSRWRKPIRRCRRRRSGDSARSQHPHQRRLVRRQSLPRARTRRSARSVPPARLLPPEPSPTRPADEAGFAFMWHSHNEREITTNNIFPGGMMMMMLVDSREFVIDESN